MVKVCFKVSQCILALEGLLDINIGMGCKKISQKQRYISPKVCYTIIEDSTRVNDLLERKNIAEVQR